MISAVIWQETRAIEALDCDSRQAIYLKVVGFNFSRGLLKSTPLFYCGPSTRFSFHSESTLFTCKGRSYVASNGIQLHIRVYIS